MLFKSLLLSALTSLSLVSASAAPWAEGIPEAQAAAEAYADAFAEAIAIAHPDPEAYALAASADDCATIACHASCGYLIIDGSACSTNATDSYSGPYNTTCLCGTGDTNFLKRYTPCMECGWTLWKYYGPYVTSALEACKTLSTEPTGTLRCSTTLSESYTKDANAGCNFGGACVSSTEEAAAANTGVSNSTVISTTGVSNSSTTSTSDSGSSTSGFSQSGSSSSGSGSSSESASSAGAAAVIGGSMGALLLALMV